MSCSFLRPPVDTNFTPTSTKDEKLFTLKICTKTAFTVYESLSEKDIKSIAHSLTKKVIFPWNKHFIQIYNDHATVVYRIKDIVMFTVEEQEAKANE